MQSVFSSPIEISKKPSRINAHEPIRMSAKSNCNFSVEASCSDDQVRAYDTNYSFELAGIEFKLQGYSQARSSFDYHEELSGDKLQADF